MIKKNAKIVVNKPNKVQYFLYCTAEWTFFTFL